MKNLKHIAISCAVASLFAFAGTAFAGTPTLTVLADPNNTNLVDLTVNNGDANSSVILYYYSAGASGPQLHSIGTTNANGYLSTSVGLSDLNITQNTLVKVTVNGQNSADVLWPYAPSGSATTTLTLSQEAVALSVGKSVSVTANKSANLYLAANPNPMVANISINGGQITVSGLSNGQTMAKICALATANSSDGCATLYIVVQTSSQGLTLSQSNVSVINGQSVSITVSGGNGYYQVLNNTNPAYISSVLSGSTLTLTATANTGTSTIILCSSDVSSCGIVNVTVGTYNSSGLTFSQTNPTIIVNQNQIITISGGYGTYYVSSNSNSAIVQPYTSTSSVNLYGANPGNATVTICSSSGACGTIYATVSGATGNHITLNQTNLGLLVGQALSVSVSGGTAPYSVISNDTNAQYSLNGNVITVTGVVAGASSATVCSSAGGCVVLNVTVTGTGSYNGGILLTFSQNNLILNVNQSSSTYLYGAGGYLVSANSNPSAVSVVLSGNSLILTGLSSGSSNISVCQTGGQCSTLFVNVVNPGSSTSNSGNVITFDKTTVNVITGGTYTMNVYGGTGVGYYVSYNSNPNVASVYVNNNQLIINGKTTGNASVSVCSTSNACGTFSVTVSGGAGGSSASGKYLFTKPLRFGSSGTEVTALQLKLIALGVYSGPITGYYGNLTTAAVKKLQKLNGLTQLGSVGPGTRAVLNK